MTNFHRNCLPFSLNSSFSLVIFPSEESASWTHLMWSFFEVHARSRDRLLWINNTCFFPFSFYSRSASSLALNEKAKNHTNSHIRIICWLCVSQWHVNNRDLCEQNLNHENNTKLLQIILHTLLSFVPLVCFYFVMGILSVSFALFDFTLVKGVSTDAFCSCNKN